jgi:hypothetical protein
VTRGKSGGANFTAVKLMFSGNLGQHEKFFRNFAASASWGEYPIADFLRKINVRKFLVMVVS